MKMKVVLVASLVVALSAACSQQVAEPAGENVVTRGADKAGGAEKVFAAYVGLRSELANGRVVSEGRFESLAEAARVASGNFSGEAKTHLEELANSAESGAGKAGEGMDQAREAFGEASKHLIALLSAEPELASGRYVFECPMAKNYPKWVQTSETVSNPYMGTKMATCGVASDWEP